MTARKLSPNHLTTAPTCLPELSSTCAHLKTPTDPCYAPATPERRARYVIVFALPLMLHNGNEMPEHRFWRRKRSLDAEADAHVFFLIEQGGRYLALAAG